MKYFNCIYKFTYHGEIEVEAENAMAAELIVQELTMGQIAKSAISAVMTVNSILPKESSEKTRS